MTRTSSGSTELRRRVDSVHRLLVVAGTALLVGACSDVTGFGSIGTFTLVAIDGAALPAPLEDGTQVTAGTIALQDEGNCEAVTAATPPGAPGQQPRTDCSWSRSGESVVVVWPDDSPSFAVLRGDTLTMSISATTPGCPPVPGASCAPSDWRFER